MVFPEVRLEGQVYLGWQFCHRVERIVQGPLVKVPWASVRHAHRGIFDLGHHGWAMTLHGHSGTSVVTVTSGHADFIFF